MESSNLTLPNSIKFCEYFNEVGLIDYDNVNTFLNIYSDVVRTSENKDENDFLKIALFSYMKLISEDDKTLFDFIKRILIAYNNHQLISRYKVLKELKSLFYFRLRNIFNFFFFKLILKINKVKTQKAKTTIHYQYKQNNQKKTNTMIKKQIFQNLDMDNLDINEKEKKELNKKITSLGNLNLSQRQIPIYLNSNNHNIKTTKSTSERVSTYISKNTEKNQDENNKNNNDNINNNNIQYNTNINNNINDNYENIQSYTIYAPALQIQSKVPIKNLKNKSDYLFKKSRPTSTSNIVSILDFNNESNINLNTSKQKNLVSSPFLTNKTFNTINNNSYDFYGNETKHLEKVNEKIINMKINKINEIEQDCTFKPKINKYKPKNINNNNLNIKTENNKPRYIQLNKDAKIRKENLDNLKLQYLNDELEKEFLSNPQNSRSKSINDPLYYEKLYNDAKILKKKSIDNLKKANEEFTFIPEINENPDYVVSMPFQQRINKSIENKKKFLQIKEEKENEYIEKINQNLKGVNSNEVVNRLYKKEMDKIKMKKQKKIDDDNKKLKKQNPINWEKVFKENNSKYSDNIYYKRKQLKIGKEEEKESKKLQGISCDSNFIENNLIDNYDNKRLKTNSNGKKGIKILINNNDNNYNNNSTDDINIEQNYQLHYNLLEKIKNEHSINFKTPISIFTNQNKNNENNNENNIENNNNINSNTSREKEDKKFIDIQSLSDNSQNNNDKNTSRDLYASPNTNIADLTPITENSQKTFVESNILDSMKSKTLKSFLEEEIKNK